MSIAADIVKKVKAGNYFRDGRKRKPANPTYIEIVKKSLPASGYEGVLYDKIESKFRAVVTINKERFYVGAFKTPERADIALRLYKYWLTLGYEEIPRGQNMRNVYYED